MKINSSELIKKMRDDMGLTQSEMAARLYIEQRTLSRIETGKQKMDMWVFVSMMEIMGNPTEDFWLLYLETEEYEAYKQYRRLKKTLHNNNHDEKLELISKLESGAFTNKRFVKQFIAFVKTTALNKNISDAERLTQLQAAIRMSRPDFDENAVADYRLNHNEVYILNDMAGTLYAVGEKERGIALSQALVASRENIQASEEDKAVLFPAIMSNLSTMLGQTGRYKESLHYCETALKICRENNNAMYIPVLLHNMASCMCLLGEVEAIWKPHLVRAYYCAYAIGNTNAGEIVKESAEKDFGIKKL